MFVLEKDDIKFGIYLRSAILQKYDSIRKFCRVYLELRDEETNDEEIRKLLNRFSQILKGKKRIQVNDLPYVTELLGVSCEEILSAGKNRVPVSNRITNYDIAFSHDKAVWDRYMKREDKLFLNCDEYGKSVIDYALDFKNYDFIKYLLDKKFIWFVDLSEWKRFGFSYGAGTSVKRRDIGSIDTHTPLEIQYQDELRTRTIALAVENEDFEVLDSLLAREIPEMHQAHMVGYLGIDFQTHRNEDLINAIALSYEKIIDYFSQEFIVTNQTGQDNTFLFPYLDDIIKAMLAYGKNDSAELLIRRAIQHNKKTLTKLKELIEESYNFYRESLGFGPSDRNDYIKKQALYNFRFDPNSNLVSFFYMPEKRKYTGLITNIIHFESKQGIPLIKGLIKEMNDLFEEITSLKGEEQ